MLNLWAIFPIFHLQEIPFLCIFLPFVTLLTIKRSIIPFHFLYVASYYIYVQYFTDPNCFQCLISLLRTNRMILCELRDQAPFCRVIISAIGNSM